MSLSPKQLIFCNEYLANGFNGTQAAIKAGYAPAYAGRTSYKLLADPKVLTYVNDRKMKLVAKIEITQEKVMQELARIAFSDIRKYFTPDGALQAFGELDDHAAGALASVETDDLDEWVDGVKVKIGVTRKVKLWDKLKALEVFAKHFKVYDDPGPVVNNYNLANLSVDEIKTLLALQQKAIS